MHAIADKPPKITHTSKSTHQYEKDQRSLIFIDVQSNLTRFSSHFLIHLLAPYPTTRWLKQIAIKSKNQ